MGKTSIEWTDESSNPIKFVDRATGQIGWHCEKISPGCAHCYAETIDARFGTKQPYTKAGTQLVEPVLIPKELGRLAKLRKPTLIFLCDMTDFFLESIPDIMRDEVFATVAQTPNAIVQILTKRPGNAARYFARREERGHVWPLPNVWLGVSVEDQKRADERIPTLLAIPANVRFLSIEPLLGPVDLSAYLAGGIHWVIVGGESGRGVRPMHPDWARAIRDQCVALDIRFFFKQWGEWAPLDLADNTIPDRAAVCLVKPNGTVIRPYRLLDGHGVEMVRVGKQAAGRLLDGRTWDEMPQTEA